MRRLSLLLLALELTGCPFARVDGTRASIPLMLSRPPQSQPYTILRHFTLEQSEWRYAGQPWSPDFAGAVTAQVQASHGDAAITLTLTAPQTFFDGCATSLTFGVAARSTFTVEGDIIQFT